MSDISRRQVVVGTGSLLIGGLAGCLADEEDETPAEPVDLHGQECDVCGMVIGEHYGPAGQVYYTDGHPDADDRDGPARFDSVSELVVYHDEQTARGREKRGAFVTDYSSVEYDLVEHDGTTYLSTHADADVFAAVEDVSFVVDSDVEGAMGPDFVPFTDRDDAGAFGEEHGGEVLEWEDLPASGGMDAH